MSNEAFLVVGGVYNITLILFHLSFWKIFNWKKDLKRITFINRAIMQVLNLSLTFIFVIFAYVSFFHSYELLTTSLGKTLLLLISIFWFLRAVYQIMFYG
ncbi:MAG: hypothetical protein V3V16_03025 [Melioribacteraceae bacterium]